MGSARINRRRALVGIASSFSAVSLARPALAQSYPARPVEFVVPFAAGQSPDVVSRALVGILSKDLGQPFVILNKPGAGGAIGYRYTVSKPADGYTMVLTSNSLSASYFGGQMDFDYTAFSNVAQITSEVPVLAVQTASPYRTLKDFLEEARRSPGNVSIATGGGTGGHMYLTSVALATAQNLDVKQVVFPTTNHVMSLLGGHTDSVITLPGSLVTNVKGGQLRVIAALGSRREPVFPEVPTAREQGIDFASDLWRGVAMPKGVPYPVLVRVEQALQRAVQSAEFKKVGDSFGFTPTFRSGSELTQLISTEHRAIEKVMERAGLLAKK